MIRVIIGQYQAKMVLKSNHLWKIFDIYIHQTMSGKKLRAKATLEGTNYLIKDTTRPEWPLKVALSVNYLINTSSHVW